MPKITGRMKNVIGQRGEAKLQLCLTDYENYRSPLFNPGFLGDKWPVIDYYVEVLRTHRKCFFFAQAKSTTRSLTATHLLISSKKSDIQGLKKIPGPTYMFGIHEPSGRIFVICVNAQTPRKAITRIPLANELTPSRLMDLHQEVKKFWQTNAFKPTKSAFS